MADTLPQAFGRYVLVQIIGEGGMAEAYFATVRVAEGLTKRVVIKKIRKEFADQPEFTRMFVEEAKIALSLNHANIVQVFDFGQVHGAFYLAMELVEGIDLMRLFHAVRGVGDAFPPVIAAYVAHQVTAGLAYAHRKADDYGRPVGIVHRDVSPHNIMASYEGQVKILDFGIARTRARAFEEGDAPTPGHVGYEETIKGKVAYMSPEQARGRSIDARSDVYSLGVVMHELLSGELLFRNKDRLKGLEAVRTVPIRPLLSAAPDVPQALARVVDRALARDPNDRYVSARAMQADLASFLHDSDPVVDDEVLSSFVGQYHTPVSTAPSIAFEQQATREIGDSHGSAPHPGPKREAQRVVVVHVALEPRQDLPDTTPDPSDFLSLVRDVAFKREAQILRSDADGVVLVLGATLSTGDEAEKALRLATTLRDDVSETAPGVSVGIVVATASAVIHHGGPSSMDVELRERVSRQIEHVARQFMEGPVIVSGDLVEPLSRRWRFEEVEMADETDPGTSGLLEPELLQPARLLGPVSEAERRSLQVGGRMPLYGRELELKSLRDTFAEAIRGRESRAILVSGAQGIGKRALIERFVGSLPRAACHVLRAAGIWSRRNVALGVFLDLVMQFLRIDHDTPRAELAERLERHDVRDAAELADALAGALGLSDAPPEPIGALAQRDRLWRLVRRLIRGLAGRRPVVIVVENIHFLDAQSLNLLLEWVQVRHPLPILALTTGPAGPRVDTLGNQPNVSVVGLTDLDEQARRDLIVQRFEDPEEAQGLADAIVARTGGNPLFIEETMSALLRRGVVGWNAQGRYLVVRQPAAKVELPPSIESALQARVEDLSPADREVLYGAAVLGRVFRPTELLDLLERSVARSLENLIERDLLQREPTPGLHHELIRFSTVSLHDVCKAAPAELSRRLHGKAADIKRARADYRPGRDDGPIADHLIEADRREQAVEYAFRAADDAREVAGNVEAYYYYSQALEALAPDDPQRFDALVERETILRAWGRRRARSADIRQMLRAAERTQDPIQGVVAGLRLLRLYLEAGRTHRAQRLLPRVAAQIDALADDRPRYRASLGELESALLLAGGHFEEAERAARSALSECDDTPGGKRQQCQIHRRIGMVRVGTGNFEDARVAYEDALTIAQAIGDRRLEASTLNSLGEVAGLSSRYQSAVDHFRDALKIDRDLGDRFATGRKLANLGITYGALGLYRRAERYLRKALELHDAVGDPGEFNDAAVHLGGVLSALGELEAATTVLTEAADTAQRRGDVRTELRAKTRLAQTLLDSPVPAENLERARTLATRAAEVGREHGLRTASARAHYVLSTLAERDGQLDDALTHARESVRLTRSGAAVMEHPRYLSRLGQLLVRSNAASSGDPKVRQEGHDLQQEAADEIRRRLHELREAELKHGYEQLPEVSQIIAEGEN